MTGFQTYTKKTFMSDGARHFDNEEVKSFCTKWETTHHIVAAYSPWVNGLVESTNTKTCLQMTYWPNGLSILMKPFDC